MPRREHTCDLGRFRSASARNRREIVLVIGLVSVAGERATAERSLTRQGDLVLVVGRHGDGARDAFTPSWGGRLVGMEGLRAVAALTVLVGHVKEQLGSRTTYGTLFDRIVGASTEGLTLFFVISGFLLYRPFAAAILRGAPLPPIGRFFRNRALRIFPAYVVILLLVNFALRTAYVTNVPAAAGVEGSSATLGSIHHPGELVANLFLVQTFIPSYLKTGIGVAWSLTTECTFYLVLPVLSIVAMRLARRSRRTGALVVPGTLLVVGLAGKLIDRHTGHATTVAGQYFESYGASWHAVFERSLLVQSDLFSWGAAAAVLFVLVEDARISRGWVLSARWGGLAVFLVGMTVVIGFPSRVSTLTATSLSALACAGALLLVVLPTRAGTHGAAARVLEREPFRYVGLISYSVYLWHLPVLWFLEVHRLFPDPSRVGLVACVLIELVVAVSLAAVTYHLVEAPALRLKRRTDVGEGAVALRPLSELKSLPELEPPPAPVDPVVLTRSG